VKIKLSETIAYDGEWEFNPDLTMGEYHRIYQLTGVPGGKVWDAITEGNVGVICALAAVALEQNGKVVDFELLLNSRQIPEIVGDVEPEDDALPPSPSGSGPDDKSSSGGRSGSGGSVAEFPATGQSDSGQDFSEPTAA
jgi:hypothetical protein